MCASQNKPPGPETGYRTSDDLLEWMSRQFETFGDIYGASVYGIFMYAVRDAEFAYHVLVENAQNYVKGLMTKRVALLLRNGLMVTEGSVWTRQRRMIQPSFNHKSLSTLPDLITGVNSRLLAKWQLAARQNASVNVTRDVSGMALEVVLRFIFGGDYEQLACHFGLLSQEPARNIGFAQAFRSLGDKIHPVIQQRRKSRPSLPDALDSMMQERDPQSGDLMSDNQLVDEILTLMVAGHETTASTLSWAWYLISQHPEVEQRLAHEVSGAANSVAYNDLPRFPYTRQVIDETMRLYPAGWLLTRKALHDDWLGKYFVPAGIEIYVPPYFIQRNPRYWKDPDRFDPDRFAPGSLKHSHRLASLPFSSGPRNCIGAAFARIEMQIHLMTIAKHLRLRYIPSGPVKLDAGVNLRSTDDFIMYPETYVDGARD